MRTGLVFTKLNDGWNAEPNGPEPQVEIDGRDLLLMFGLNPFMFPRFRVGDTGILRFRECTAYRLGETNSDGWFLGQCRYSRLAPEWGEFFELSGDDPARDAPLDRVRLFRDPAATRHYLVYFRDDTFECLAKSWELEKDPANDLISRGLG